MFMRTILEAYQGSNQTKNFFIYVPFTVHLFFFESYKASCYVPNKHFQLLWLA